jgi:hypothetical protein
VTDFVIGVARSDEPIHVWADRGGVTSLRRDAIHRYGKYWVITDASIGRYYGAMTVHYISRGEYGQRAVHFRIIVFDPVNPANGEDGRADLSINRHLAVAVPLLLYASHRALIQASIETTVRKQIMAGGIYLIPADREEKYFTYFGCDLHADSLSLVGQYGMLDLGFYAIPIFFERSKIIFPDHVPNGGFVVRPGTLLPLPIVFDETRAAAIEAVWGGRSPAPAQSNVRTFSIDRTVRFPVSAHELVGSPLATIYQQPHVPPSLFPHPGNAIAAIEELRSGAMSPGERDWYDEYGDEQHGAWMVDSDGLVEQADHPPEGVFDDENDEVPGDDGQDDSAIRRTAMPTLDQDRVGGPLDPRWWSAPAA